MNVQYFTEAALSFFAGITAFNIFLNFLLLAAEELKKCSIINKKKKRYAVLHPAGKPVRPGAEQALRA